MTYLHSVGNEGEPTGETINVCQRGAMFTTAGVACLASGLDETRTGIRAR